MNTILDKKYEALKVMTYSLARKTKYYFFSRMSSCGCVGWLKFDHPKEELLISVRYTTRYWEGEKNMGDIWSIFKYLSEMCLFF